MILFILNYLQSFPVIVSENEEEFDLSIFNDVYGVDISNTMKILEIISNFMSDTFTLIDLELPVNSYMIACTNFQNFEGKLCIYHIGGAHSWV